MFWVSKVGMMGIHTENNILTIQVQWKQLNLSRMCVEKRNKTLKRLIQVIDFENTYCEKKNRTWNPSS